MRAEMMQLVCDMLMYKRQLGVGFEFSNCEQEESLGHRGVRTKGRVSICREGGVGLQDRD